MAGRPKGQPVSSRIQIGPEETFLALGMRGTGKTTLCQRIVAAWRPRVTVWDPLSQYDPGVSYRPETINRRVLNHVASWCWSQAPWSFVLEEMEQVVPQGPSPAQSFKDYVQLGRNLGLRWGGNVRRPQALSKFVLDEVDHFFIFKLDGRALSYMVERIGGREGRQLWAMKRWVKDPRQGGGQFYHYHEGELALCRPLPAPAKAVAARSSVSRDVPR